jgi:uncharacterized protein YkwD
MISTRLSMLAGILLTALTLIPAAADAAQQGHAAQLAGRPAAKPVAGSLGAAMKAWRDSRLAKAGVRSRALATPVVAPAEPCADTTTIPDATNVERIRASVLCLVNEQRGANGLVPLTDNIQLRAAAQAHSDDMVGRAYFGHVTPDGTDFDARIFAAGYADVGHPMTWDILAENIAWGADVIATPVRTVENWMASPAHRANILDARLRESGIGVGLGAPDATITGPAATYTQDFGTH